MNCESVAYSHAKTIGTNFALKSFYAIINLVSELWNTIEFPLRILYFTPNVTDMLLIVDADKESTSSIVSSCEYLN